MIFALIDPKTGELSGPFHSKDKATAKQNRPDIAGAVAVQLADHDPHDLAGLWAEKDSAGAWVFVPVAEVKNAAALGAIAALEAEQGKTQTLTDLAATDTPLIRAIEDLISTLITKGVLSEEDLPQPVRDKIKARESLRAALNG